MAPKRPSPLDEPPAASSSDEQEEASSEEEEEDPSEEEEDEDEEEEEESEKAPKKASTLASPTKKIVSKARASESGAESSSDSEPGDSGAVKPIATKPMEDSSAAAKKPRSKPGSTPAKRPGESEASKSSKRAKKKEQVDNGASEDEPKKSGDEKKLFQRLWSEEDEIAILKGMIDFASKKGSDPSADMGGFHEFIKKSIHVEDFTKAQLVDKVRRLRKKYENNAAKKKYDPTKPHERKAFDLSKKIWGGDSDEPRVNGTPISATPARSSALRGSVKTPLPSAKAELVSPPPEPEAKPGDSGLLCGVLALEKSPLPESVVRRGLDLIPEDKKAELEAKWKKIHLAELELFAKRTQLMSEQSRLIFDALKSDY